MENTDFDKPPQTKRIKAEVNSQESTIVCAIKQNPILHNLLVIPQTKASQMSSQIHRLSEFINHLIFEQEDISRFKNLLFPEMKPGDSLFQEIVKLTNMEEHFSSLYNSFVRGLSNGSLSTETIKVDTSLSTTTIQKILKSTCQIPSKVWIDVVRKSPTSILPLPVTGFELFQQSSSVKNLTKYYLQMAIVQKTNQECFVALKNTENCWFTFSPENPTFVPVPRNAVIFQIFKSATSLLYVTEEFQISECCDVFGKHQNEIRNDLDEISDEESDKGSIGSLISDFEYESETLKLELSNKRMINPKKRSNKRSTVQQDRNAIMLQSLRERIRANESTKDFYKGHELTETDRENLILFLANAQGFNFVFQRITYNLRTLVKLNVFQVANATTAGETIIKLCQRCLVEISDFSLRCPAHYDSTVGISVAVAVSSVNSLYRLAVLRVHTRNEKPDCILMKLKSEATSKLSSLSLDRSSFHSAIVMNHHSLLTFSEILSAKSYQIALQIFNWLLFKFNTKEKNYFTQKAVGIGNNTLLGEFVPNETKRHLIDAFAAAGFSFVVKKIPLPDLMNDNIRKYRFRPITNRNLANPRPKKNRLTVYALVCAETNELYYGKDSHRDRGVAGYHKDAPKWNFPYYEELCFSTKESYILDAVEGCVQLAALLCFIFDIVHPQHNVVMKLSNCKIEAVKSTPEGVSFLEFLNRVMALEFQAQIKLTKLEKN